MSRRTFEANKAILAAWEKEQDLVREGKGTRDWTQEQQQAILERGKAYDDNGRAFEGQHMKSVEKYPEYQGDPNNIQFLTKAEHLEAHQGNWQNPTNWYYDPVSKQFFAFGECELIPCEIIELSNPIVAIEAFPADAEVEMFEEMQKEQSSGADPPIEVSAAKQPSVPQPTKSAPGKQTSKGSVMEGLVNGVKVVKEIFDKHPKLTTGAKVGLGIAAAFVTGKVIDTKIKAEPSGSVGHGLMNHPTVKAITDNVVDVISNSKFDFKKYESALKQLGYTVAKNIGLQDDERQIKLQEAITNGVMSKEEICAFLEKNINLHKNQANFEEAVNKWRLDLAFLKNCSGKVEL